MKLAEAITKLDHSNDAHWTDDGMPRVEILREMTGETNLTRKQITNAAPNLKRGANDGEDQGSGEPEGEVPTSVQQSPEGAEGEVLGSVQSTTPEAEGSGSDDRGASGAGVGPATSVMPASDWSEKLKALNAEAAERGEKLEALELQRLEIQEKIKAEQDAISEIHERIKLGNEPATNDVQARQAFMRRSSRSHAAVAAASAAAIVRSAGVGAQAQPRTPAHLMGNPTK